MFETITVAEAISRGKKMVNVPQFLIFFISIGLCIFLTVEFNVSPWIILAGFVIGFLLMWVFWAYTITKWRLWAFENVRNVHELRRKALEAKLIRPEGSFWDRTLIQTMDDKVKWELLQRKFDAPDAYTEDLLVPDETLVYYSKWLAWFQIGIMAALLIFVGYLNIFTAGPLLASLIAGGFGLFIGFRGYRHLMSKNPQIILNNDGIETVNIPFVAWADVTNDNVITRQQGKSSVTSFEFDYPDGSASIQIDELNINKATLENLLHTYRVRSEKKVNRSATTLTS